MRWLVAINASEKMLRDKKRPEDKMEGIHQPAGRLVPEVMAKRCEQEKVPDDYAKGNYH